MAREVHSFFLIRMQSRGKANEGNQYIIISNYEREMNRGWAEVIKYLAH